MIEESSATDPPHASTLDAGIGLELEISGACVRPFVPKATILVEGQGWNLETDKLPNKESAHLEFVIAPMYDWPSLARALGDILRWIGRLREHALASKDRRVMLRELVDGNDPFRIVEGRDALTIDVRDVHFKTRMQATYGVSLAGMRQQVDHVFGAGQAAECHESTRRADARHAALSGDPLRPHARGFVELINAYIVCARVPRVAQVATVHIYFRMLARSDFCAVFDQVLDAEDQAQVRALLQAPAAGEASPLLDALGLSPDSLLFSHPYYSKRYADEASPTIQAWLHSILHGRGEGTLRKDLMSPPPGYPLHTADIDLNYGAGGMGCDPRRRLVLFEIRRTDFRRDLPLNNAMRLAALFEYMQAATQNPSLPPIGPELEPQLASLAGMKMRERLYQVLRDVRDTLQLVCRSDKAVDRVKLRSVGLVLVTRCLHEVQAATRKDEATSPAEAALMAAADFLLGLDTRADVARLEALRPTYEMLLSRAERLLWKAHAVDTSGVPVAPAAAAGAHEPAKSVDVSTVKLVIWDLDDTFWRGTLSEGGITARTDTREAVIALSRQGIVNSIASNNDLEPVRRVLEEMGLWDHFVFRRVDWSSKAEQVLSIIAAMQLRPEDVVFLDDKDRIRAEVSATVPSLRAAMSVEDFLELRSAPGWPRPPWKDESLDRLAHYRLLERKHEARRHAGAGRADGEAGFLRECSITCRIDHDVEAQVERIHELVNRTNQLNFTQKRIESLDAVRELLRQPGRDSAVVQVADKFGDYGICGFYSRPSANDPLDHFLFSCRALNMGVEQAVYRHIGGPAVQAADGRTRVLSELQQGALCGEWVAITTGAAAVAEPAACRAGPRKRVHFTGGCDVTPLAALCQSQFGARLSIGTQLTTINERGTRIAVRGAAPLLRLAASPELVREHQDVLDRIPWLDRSCFSHPIFEKDAVPYDLFVISAQRDGLMARYRYRDTDLVIPGEYFRAGRRNIADPADWDVAARRIRRSAGPLPKGFREFFLENFRFEGLHDARGYAAHIEWLLGELPPGARLVYLNLSEVGHGYEVLDTSLNGWLSWADMEAEAEHHRMINRVLDDVAARDARLKVVDIRRHLRSAADARDLNHFSREVAMKQWSDLVPHLQSML
jgi:FkbH-like protein